MSSSLMATPGPPAASHHASESNASPTNASADDASPTSMFSPRSAAAMALSSISRQGSQELSSSMAPRKFAVPSSSQDATRAATPKTSDVKTSAPQLSNKTPTSSLAVQPAKPESVPPKRDLHAPAALYDARMRMLQQRPPRQHETPYAAAPHHHHHRGRYAVPPHGYPYWTPQHGHYHHHRPSPAPPSHSAPAPPSYSKLPWGHHQHPGMVLYYAPLPPAPHAHPMTRGQKHAAVSTSMVTPTPAKKLKGPDGSAVRVEPPPSVSSQSSSEVTEEQDDELSELKYNRKKKSLGVLAGNFLEKFAEWPAATANPPEIIIDRLAIALEVERRRIYDVVNILEALQLVVKKGKNSYHWMGKEHLSRQFALLQNEAIDQWPETAAKAGLIASANGKQDGTNPKFLHSGNNKSLTRLSQVFLQIFLVGNDNVSLPDASDLIHGGPTTPEDLAAMGSKDGKMDLSDSYQFKQAAARGLKTKIRRLYDIANVFLAVGFLTKEDDRASNFKRPVYSWAYSMSTQQIRGLYQQLPKRMREEKTPFGNVPQPATYPQAPPPEMQRSPTEGSAPSSAKAELLEMAREAVLPPATASVGVQATPHMPPPRPLATMGSGNSISSSSFKTPSVSGGSVGTISVSSSSDTPPAAASNNTTPDTAVASSKDDSVLRHIHRTGGASDSEESNDTGEVGEAKQTSPALAMNKNTSPPTGVSKVPAVGEEGEQSSPPLQSASGCNAEASSITPSGQENAPKDGDDDEAVFRHIHQTGGAVDGEPRRVSLPAEEQKRSDLNEAQ